MFRRVTVQADDSKHCLPIAIGVIEVVERGNVNNNAPELEIIERGRPGPPRY